MPANEDPSKGRTLKRIAILVVTFVIAVTIISSTLGREIIAGRTPGLESFAIIHFAGYLFFLLMPFYTAIDNDKVVPDRVTDQ